MLKCCFPDLELMNRFKAIVIGDELAHGKPHPMPYLEGLRAVGAAPDLSLAFEDFALRDPIRFRRRNCNDWNPDELSAMATWLPRAPS